jgi:hypothetical protein
MTKLLISALKYHELGFSVIPVKLNKKPYLKWEQYQKKRADEAEIKKWWKKWPNANIGIVTGSISDNLCAIDIDIPDEALPILDNLLPDSLETIIVNTPSGGQHYWFKMDETLHNNSRVIAGADFRGEGGYIVAPPSKNGNGKIYEFQGKISPLERDVAYLPDSYIDYVTKVTGVTNVTAGQLSPLGEHVLNEDKCISYNKSSLSFKGVTDSVTLSFDKGQRDESIFTVANVLQWGGFNKEKTMKVIEMIAQSCNPPFPLKEAIAKVESVYKRRTRQNQSLASAVEEWIELQDGNFTVTAMYHELRLLHPRDKTAARVKLKRMCDAGIIERVGKNSGAYRKIEKEENLIDWKGTETEIVDVSWPLKIGTLVDTYPKSISIIAGSPNSGKTAFLLNLIKDNMHKHKINYFSSEMGDIELKSRLEKFELPLDDWKFKAIARAHDFQDVIKPNEINIIDYLEIHEEHYRVGGWIKQIFDKLDKGIAVIAIQKKHGSSVGVGGLATLEKPRLYMTMEGGIAKIEKAKNWKYSNINPNGMQMKYKLVDGCKFITEIWGLE